MRGNEGLKIAHTHPGLKDAFPIPMRGNEDQPWVQELFPLARVPDPHEG